MSASHVIKLNSHGELLRYIRETQGLVLLVFSAEWCGPCKLVAQWLDAVSSQFRDSLLFLLIKQEIIQESFISYNVDSLPSFVLIQGGKELERLTGNNKQGVIQMISSHIKVTNGKKPVAGDRHESTTTANTIANGKFFDLHDEIDKEKSFCLNAVNEKQLCQILEPSDMPLDGGTDAKTFILHSDVDAQIIITLTFVNPVQLYGFYLLGPEDIGPKDVSVYANENRQLDFDYCEQSKPIQEFSISKRSLSGIDLSKSLTSAVHKFKTTIFRNVSNLSFFIRSNQSDDLDKSTVITCLRVYGCPVKYSGMSLQNFKRVAGSPNTPHE